MPYSPLLKKYFDGATLLSGKSYECPLCGEKKLTLRNVRFWEFPILTCGGCGFAGNVASLYSKDNNTSYSEAIAETSLDPDRYSGFDHTLDLQRFAFGILKRGRKNLEDNLYKCTRILGEHGLDLNLQKKPHLYPHIFFVNKDDGDKLWNKKQKPRLKKQEAIVVPYFLLPGMVSSLFIIYKNSYTFFRCLKKSRTHGIDETGIHIMDPGVREITAIDDPLLALQVYDLYKENSTGKCPLAIYNSKTSIHCWEPHDIDSINLLTTENRIPFSISSLKNTNRDFKAGRLDKKGFKSNIGRLNIKKLLDMAKEKTGPWPSFVKKSLLEMNINDGKIALDNLNLSQKDIDRIINSASDEELKKLDPYFNILSNKRLRLGNYIYTRLDEGGLIKVTKRQNVKTEVATADIRIDRYLKLDNDEIFLRGTLVSEGKEIPFEVESDTLATTSKTKKWLKDVCVSGGIKPPFINNYREWVKVSRQFSNAVVEKAYSQPGFDEELDRFVLPNYIISNEIEEENLVLGEYENCQIKRDKYIDKNLLKDQYLKSTPENECIWRVFIGLTGQICNDLFCVEDTIINILGNKDSLASNLTKSVAENFDIPEGKQLENYSFLTSKPERMGILNLQPLDAYFANLNGNIHHLFAMTKKTYFSMTGITDLFLEFVKYATNNRNLIESRDCGYENVANTLYKFLKEEYEVDPSILREAANGIVCNNFLIEDTDYNKNSFACRFLTLVFYILQTNIVSLDMGINDSEVVISLEGLFKDLKSRMKDLNVSIDEVELVESFRSEKALKEGSVSELVIKKDYWNKVYEGWEKSELENSTTSYI